MAWRTRAGQRRELGDYAALLLALRPADGDQSTARSRHAGDAGRVPHQRRTGDPIDPRLTDQNPHDYFE